MLLKFKRGLLHLFSALFHSHWPANCLGLQYSDHRTSKKGAYSASNMNLFFFFLPATISRNIRLTPSELSLKHVAYRVVVTSEPPSMFQQYKCEYFRDNSIFKLCFLSLKITKMDLSSGDFCCVLFCLGTISNNAQRLLLALGTYSWQCLGNHVGCQGFKSRLAPCKPRALHAVLFYLPQWFWRFPKYLKKYFIL